MKKIFLFIFLFSILSLLSWCKMPEIDNESALTKEIQWYNCDKEMKECEKVSLWENVKMFKIDEELCDIAKSEFDQTNFNERTVLNENISNTISIDYTSHKFEKKNGIGQIDFKGDNTQKNGKIIDIMFDLTYYSLTNPDIDKNFFENRKKILKQYLSSNELFSLNYGDKVILRFIWSQDYWDLTHDNEVASEADKIEYPIWDINENWQLNTSTLSVRCVDFSDLKKIYINISNSNETEKTQEELSTQSLSEIKTKLIADIEQIIDNKRENFWQGTYLLQSLSHNDSFLNSNNQNTISLIFSDFRFQLHPEMKSQHNIKSDSRNFPPAAKNLNRLKNPNSEYNNFYNSIKNKYLSNKCNNNEDLYLISIRDDNLDMEKSMKSFYVNSLFKWCNVIFK